jgi:formaldehyde-activating enzyme involved in methanogenesis
MVTLARDSEAPRFKLSTKVRGAFVGGGPELANIDIAIGQRGTPFECIHHGTCNSKMGHMPCSRYWHLIYGETCYTRGELGYHKRRRPRNRMFGPDQVAVARAVLDRVQNEIILKVIVDEVLIIASVYIHSNAKNNVHICANNYDETNLQYEIP